MLDKISVRAVPGRLARTSPRGAFIPHDRFVSVEMSPYIHRLLNVHRDIELEPKPAAVAKASETPAPQSKTKGA